jgi:hypothetical protein
MSSSSSIVLDDLFDQLDLTVNGENRDFSVVKLPNPQEGTYQLKLKNAG